MGFMSDIADAWREGGRPAGSSPRRRDVPKPTAAVSKPKPTPIKIGRYLNRHAGQVGAPLLYHGERHVILAGLARAGKQTRILSELAMTSRSRSGFWVDTKGTIRQTCGDEMARHSKLKTVCPYPVEGIEDDGYNPLDDDLDPDSDTSFADARAIVNAIFERMEGGTGAHFSDSAAQLCAAGVLFEVQQAKAAGRTPLLHNVIRQLMEADKFEPLLDVEGKVKKGPSGRDIEKQTAGVRLWIVKMIDEGGPLISRMAGRFMREAGKDEIAGIYSTAITQLSDFLDPCIERCLSASNRKVSLRKLRDEPTSVIVVLPPDKGPEQPRFTKLLLSCAIRGHFRPGKYTTLFVLDEFLATVGKLQILAKNWAVVPEFGMQFMPVVQSLEHLQTCWGNEWEGMVAQAGIVATLGPTGDKLSSEFFSERCGETTLPQAGFTATGGAAEGFNDTGGNSNGPGGVTSNAGRGRNVNNQKGVSYSLQQMKRRYLLPQDFRSLQPGEGRIVVAGEGRLSIPFYAPEFFKQRAPWVARMKPNPLYNG